jgi:hypothetical protein
MYLVIFVGSLIDKDSAAYLIFFKFLPFSSLHFTTQSLDTGNPPPFACPPAAEQ